MKDVKAFLGSWVVCTGTGAGLDLVSRLQSADSGFRTPPGTQEVLNDSKRSSPQKADEGGAVRG